MEIGWIYYGFSGAIANFVVWISLFFPVVTGHTMQIPNDFIIETFKNVNVLSLTYLDALGLLAYGTTSCHG